MDSTVLFVLYCVACFSLGYWLWSVLGTPHRRQKLKCKLGWHAPDTIIREDDNHYYQRCLYCDDIVHRFERDTTGNVRRIM